MSATIDLGLVGGAVLARLSGSLTGLARCQVVLLSDEPRGLEPVAVDRTLSAVQDVGLLVGGFAVKSTEEFYRRESFCLIPWGRIAAVHLTDPALRGQRQVTLGPYGSVPHRAPAAPAAGQTNHAGVQEALDQRLKTWATPPDANLEKRLHAAAAILFAAVGMGCQEHAVASAVSAHEGVSRDEVIWIIRNYWEKHGVWREGGSLGWNITGPEDDAFWLAAYIPVDLIWSG